MNTRETLISRGKIWIVYPDGKHKDKDILFDYCQYFDFDYQEVVDMVY